MKLNEKYELKILKRLFDWNYNETEKSKVLNNTFEIPTFTQLNAIEGKLNVKKVIPVNDRLLVWLEKVDDQNQWLATHFIVMNVRGEIIFNFNQIIAIKEELNIPKLYDLILLEDHTPVMIFQQNPHTLQLSFLNRFVDLESQITNLPFITKSNVSLIDLSINNVDFSNLLSFKDEEDKLVIVISVVDLTLKKAFLYTFKPEDNEDGKDVDFELHDTKSVNVSRMDNLVCNLEFNWVNYPAISFTQLNIPVSTEDFFIINTPDVMKSFKNLHTDEFESLIKSMYSTSDYEMRTFDLKVPLLSNATSPIISDGYPSQQWLINYSDPSHNIQQVSLIFKSSDGEVVVEQSSPSTFILPFLSPLPLVKAGKLISVFVAWGNMVVIEETKNEDKVWVPMKFQIPIYESLEDFEKDPSELKIGWCYVVAQFYKTKKDESLKMLYDWFQSSIDPSGDWINTLTYIAHYSPLQVAYGYDNDAATFFHVVTQENEKYDNIINRLAKSLNGESDIYDGKTGTWAYKYDLKENIGFKDDFVDYQMAPIPQTLLTKKPIFQPKIYTFQTTGYNSFADENNDEVVSTIQFSKFESPSSKVFKTKVRSLNDVMATLSKTNPYIDYTEWVLSQNNTHLKLAAQEAFIDKYNNIEYMNNTTLGLCYFFPGFTWDGGIMYEAFPTWSTKFRQTDKSRYEYMKHRLVLSNQKHYLETYHSYNQNNNNVSDLRADTIQFLRNESQIDLTKAQFASSFHNVLTEGNLNHYTFIDKNLRWFLSTQLIYNEFNSNIATPYFYEQYDNKIQDFNLIRITGSKTFINCDKTLEDKTLSQNIIALMTVFNKNEFNNIETSTWKVISNTNNWIFEFDETIKKNDSKLSLSTLIECDVIDNTANTNTIKQWYSTHFANLFISSDNDKFILKNIILKFEDEERNYRIKPEMLQVVNNSIELSFSFNNVSNKMLNNVIIKNDYENEFVDMKVNRDNSTFNFKFKFYLTYN